MFTIPVLIIVWIFIIHLSFEYFLKNNIDQIRTIEKSEAEAFVQETENDINYHIRNLLYYSSRIDAYVQNRFYNIDSVELKQLIWDLVKNNDENIKAVSITVGKYFHSFNSKMESINEADFNTPSRYAVSKKSHPKLTYSFIKDKKGVIFHIPFNVNSVNERSHLDILLEMSNFLETTILEAENNSYKFALTDLNKNILYGSSELFAINGIKEHNFDAPANELRMYFYRQVPVFSKTLIVLTPWVMRLLSLIILVLVVLYFINREKADKNLSLYKLLSDHSKDVVWVYNISQDKFSYVSPSVVGHRGYTQEEAMKHKLTDSLTNESAININSILQKRIDEFRSSKKHEEYLIEVQQLTKEGGSFWAEISYTLNINKDDEIEIIGNTRKIDSRKESELSIKRLNRELYVTSLLEKSLLVSKNEDELLNDVCTIVCNNLGYKLAWIGYKIDDEESNVKPVAFAGIGREYILKANTSWNADKKSGKGPTGRAIRSGKTQVCADIFSDPDMVLWVENATKFNFSSSISIPLIKDGKTFGALMIYSSEKNAFDNKEIMFLEKIADDLSFGISYLHIKNENKSASERLKQIHELSDLCSWEYDFGSNTYTLYENCYEIFGLPNSPTNEI
ncbi:MAG: GAF domain-containing protein, partial [Thiovulaceae bacterium]|nr:GAF domain-containing protein [Sulfurimonadaceae bacterium]